MKIAYCGYDFFHSCMNSIAQNGHEVVELFTWPTDNEYDFNDNVLKLATDLGCRISLSPITRDDLQRLRDSGVELLLTAAYPYKVPDWTGFVKYGLNVHPSLLPVGRGPWPLPWVILKEEQKSGVTVHELSDGWDSGDIVAQSKFLLNADETLESLSVKSQLTAEKLVSDVIENLDNLWEQKIPQNEGSYWAMPSAKDRTLDFSKSTREIDRKVRAFSKFEPFAFFDGQRYFVRSVKVWESEHDHKPGEIVHKTNREWVVAVPNGFVCLSHFVKA